MEAAGVAGTGLEAAAPAAAKPGTRPPGRRGRRRGVAAAVVLGLGVVGGGVAAGVAVTRPRQPSIRQAGPVGSAYLAAWGHRDWAAMAARAHGVPADFAATHTRVFSDLAATTATFSAVAFEARHGEATMTFAAHLVLAGLGPWDYQGRLPLRVRQRHWVVEWSPSVIHPALAPGDHFVRTRTVPARASVLAADGRELAKVPGTTDLVGQVAATPTPSAATPNPGPSSPTAPAAQAGDLAGTSGLEAFFNARLAGQASGDVGIVDASGRPRPALYHFAGVAGAPVRSTIDPATQGLAERVLAPVTQPAALVAIDVPSGAVRAIVSHPDGGFPRALVGRYPPGSTFKIVTATAAITSGLTPASVIDCPPSVTVNGKTFTNAEHEQLGPISFQTAFARSCNTAFLNIARKLGDAQLEAAAAAFGVGTGWPFPVQHFDGSLPPPASSVERVADAIGQGRVAVSPLLMASMAAAVARGAWQPPRLVDGAAPGTPTPLPAGVAADLRLFMRSVVTDGTGAGADVAGEPVYAKTGTAEFGTANPPSTHAWLVGWRGNVAFAVIVEGGGFGGDVAAPLAAQFLRGI